MTLQNGNAWAAAFGHGSHSGKSVTVETALQLATVWACIRLTAQAVSCLPLSMYQRSGDDDRVKVSNDEDIAEVICDSPNEDQTPLEFWETNVAWLMAMGNAYSEKVETGRRLTALQPIASTNCHPVRKADGGLVYRVVDRGQTEELPRDKIFHLKGFGFGGDMGLSPIRFGVQTFGSAIAIEESSGKIFGSGLQASGILSSDNTLDK
ncbi:MAG: phage portal protein, partial [Phyllobacterium sp.]